MPGVFSGGMEGNRRVARAFRSGQGQPWNRNIYQRKGMMRLNDIVKDSNDWQGQSAYATVKRGLNWKCGSGINT